MSDGTDRRSMDDVLASIRRIVRAENAPEAEPASRGMPQDDTVETGGGDEPLALTPDMRIDGGAVEPEAIARPAGLAEAAAPAAIADSPATPDREALRGLVREILAEELTDGDAEGAVRSIIRDELVNGEIGGNVSQNVLRLIRSEIAKALEGR
ncbi:MAG TPA: hypothetical protein VFJ13_02015 [Paracoccaceae bacterium]|nr:hypothetical protein [Paracoccaceae bacterium]